MSVKGGYTLKSGCEITGVTGVNYPDYLHSLYLKSLEHLSHNKVLHRAKT